MKDLLFPISSPWRSILLVILRTRTRAYCIESKDKSWIMNSRWPLMYWRIGRFPQETQNLALGMPGNPTDDSYWQIAYAIETPEEHYIESISGSASPARGSMSWCSATLFQVSSSLNVTRMSSSQTESKSTLHIENQIFISLNSYIANHLTYENRPLTLTLTLAQTLLIIYHHTCPGYKILWGANLRIHQQYNTRDEMIIHIQN